MEVVVLGFCVLKGPIPSLVLGWCVLKGPQTLRSFGDGVKKFRPFFKCSSSQSDHILEKLAPSSCVSAS